MLTTQNNQVTNKFGSSVMLTGADLVDKKVFIYNCACLTIQSEVLGWANANKSSIVTSPQDADTIVVLGCQVTDFAILNDILTAEALSEKYTADVVMGGCLAQRFEIPLNFKRVDLLESDYTAIEDSELVSWQPPFWSTEERFFRTGLESYIRVGKGCHGWCSYCTIRETRKEYKALDISKLEEQFEHAYCNNRVVIPTCDTLLPARIEALSTFPNQFYLRNIEPSTLVKVKGTLTSMSKYANIAWLHVPIQSTNSKVLESMNRDPDHVYESLYFLKYIKEEYGIKLATNVITGFENVIGGYKPKLDIDKLFDHVSVNPYWGGAWNRENAVLRMKKYVPNYITNIA